MKKSCTKSIKRSKRSQKGGKKGKRSKTARTLRKYTRSLRTLPHYLTPKGFELGWEGEKTVTKALDGAWNVGDTYKRSFLRQAFVNSQPRGNDPALVTMEVPPSVNSRTGGRKRKLRSRRKRKLR